MQGGRHAALDVARAAVVASSVGGLAGPPVVAAVGRRHLRMLLQPRPGPLRRGAAPAGIRRLAGKLADHPRETGQVRGAGGRCPARRLRIVAFVPGVFVGRDARAARALGDAVRDRSVGHLHPQQPVALPADLVENIGDPVARLGDVPVVAEDRRVDLVGHQQGDDHVQRERHVLIVVAGVVPAAVDVAGLPFGPAVDIKLRRPVLPRRKVARRVMPGATVGLGNIPAATLVEVGADGRFEHRQVHVVGNAEAVRAQAVLGIVDVVGPRRLQGRDVGVPHLVAGGRVGLAAAPGLEINRQYRRPALLAADGRFRRRRILRAGILPLFEGWRK